ncbi:MAG: S8 family peptidase [Candidatus Zixiibacteriota bacterium]|nr:MAG: S8 family peptidase [candidate division Zixibacteria bacterium]
MTSDNRFLTNKRLWFSICLPICLILLLPVVSASQEKGPFEYPIDTPKINLKTQSFLQGLPPDSAVAVWVFFRDKGIKSAAEYEVATDEVTRTLSERSLRRRMLRGRRPWVDFTDLPVRREYLNELESLGAKIRVVSKWLNAASVSANRQQVQKIESFSFVRAVKKVATFRRAKPREEERLFKKSGEIPSEEDLPYGESYTQLAQIHVPELHRMGLSGDSVLITILDTGFFIDHPAFEHIRDSDRLVDTYDFINGDDDVWDADTGQGAHGTSVLSVAGGFVEENLIGSAYGAQFALAKTEIQSEEIQIEEDHWVAGLEWGEGLGTDVVSSSLGYTDWYTHQDLDGNTAICTQAADLAVSKGVVVVNAAGNERTCGPPPCWEYVITPADGDSVIAVGAVDANGDIAHFSSKGPTFDGRVKPDVVAMGVGTYCATVSGYGNLGGTSFATPLVAGICALLLEAHPDWSPFQVGEALRTTADRAGDPDTLFGYGLANAAKASGFDYLMVSPQELSFETSLGDTHSQRSLLEITNWQEDWLEWGAHPTADWISVFPDTGSAPALIWVTVDPSHLKAGTNIDSVVISADSAINLFQKVPVFFTLHPGVQVLAFPNPFSDSLTVIIEAGGSLTRVKIEVFTAAGESVYRFPEKQTEGIYQQAWDGRNENGEEIASGVYLLHVDIGGRSEIHKVAKVK